MNRGNEQKAKNDIPFFVAQPAMSFRELTSLSNKKLVRQALIHFNHLLISLFAFLYLTLHCIECQINSFLECASTLLADNISTRNMQRNEC